MAELTVKLGDQVLQTRALKGDLLRVGRSRENDIILENLGVSRNHLQIRLHQGRYVLIDMSSANGTFLNGTRVTKKDLLDGDQIKVGKHLLIFRDLAEQSTVLDAPPEAKRSASPGARSKYPTPDGRANAWLAVESGRLKGREFKVVRFETSLGKSPSNDVVLTDDWLISKKQAIIIRKGNDEFEIQDLGGLRKLKVNGIAVEDRMELKAGDVVEVGGTRLVFHSDAPVSRSTTPISRNRGPKLVPTGKQRSIAPPSDGATDSGNFARVEIVNGSDSPALQHVKSAGMAASAAAALAADNDSLDLEHLFEAPAPEKPVVAEEPVAAAMASLHSAMAAVSGASSTPATQRVRVVSSAARASDLPEKMAPGANDKEIEMWESALNSQSAAIRRQAARMLKKLTGREYDA